MPVLKLVQRITGANAKKEAKATPPQEIEVDVHFQHIERLMEEFQPKRVVFDSLSTYGSSLRQNCTSETTNGAT